MKQAQFSSADIAAACATVAPVVIAPVTSAKQEKELAVTRRLEARENARHELIERDAENRRYDNEGVYYIGGKCVETRYGY